MASPQRVSPLIQSVVVQGGVAVRVLAGYSSGGVITNPLLADDQGTPNVEMLYVDSVQPATLYASDTTIALYPGYSYSIPPGADNPTWVNAYSPGHRFSGYVLVAPIQYPPTPITGPFPPNGPTSMISIIPSYLYWQYNDDSDLNAFVNSYNGLAQKFLNTVNNLNLPIWTWPGNSGALLDWIAGGIWGLVRPVLYSGMPHQVGPFNTFSFNDWVFNDIELLDPLIIIATTDDIFRRIMTWALQKSDGKNFDIRWLKRRVLQFLAGVNGVYVDVSDTSRVSVTFGPPSTRIVAIRIVNFITQQLNGALFDTFEFNTTSFNELNTEVTPLSTAFPYNLQNEQIFYDAVFSNAIELPFQFEWKVDIQYA